MATLIVHADKIRSDFRLAMADKVLTAKEALSLAGEVVEAARCAYVKLTDKAQFNALVLEAEALYDALVDPAKFDIPRVPEIIEVWAVSLGRTAIRPALEKFADLVDGVQ